MVALHCWRWLAGGCNLTGPRNIFAEISSKSALCIHVDLRRAAVGPLTCMVSNFDSAKARAQPSVDRQGGGRFSFEGDILADGGSWHTRQSSKSIFSTITTFHVTVNG